MTFEREFSEAYLYTDSNSYVNEVIRRAKAILDTCLLATALATFFREVKQYKSLAQEHSYFLNAAWLHGICNIYFEG